MTRAQRNYWLKTLNLQVKNASFILSVDFLRYLITVMENQLTHVGLMYLAGHIVSGLSGICSLGTSCDSVLGFW